jgi:hypothetical protein
MGKRAPARSALARELTRKRYQADPARGREKARRYREANPEKCREAVRKWEEANPDKARGSRLKHRYGLSLDRHEELLRVHKHKCGSCGDRFTKENPACVDHCHNTNVVRGLLCHDCNTAEGRLKTPERVLRLYNYMIKNSLFYGA